MEPDEPGLAQHAELEAGKEKPVNAETIEQPANCWERYRSWYERHLEQLNTMVLASNPTVHTIEEQDAVRYAVEAAKSRFDQLANDAYDRWEHAGSARERFAESLDEVTSSVYVELEKIWRLASDEVFQWGQERWRPAVDHVLPRKTRRWNHRAQSSEIVQPVTRDDGAALRNMVGRLQKLQDEEDQNAPAPLGGERALALSDSRRVLAYVSEENTHLEGGFSGAFLETVRQTIRDLGIILGSPEGSMPLEFCLQALLRELASEREPLYVPMLARLNQGQLSRYCWIPEDEKGGYIYGLPEALKWYSLRLLGVLDFESHQKSTLTGRLTAPFGAIDLAANQHAPTRGTLDRPSQTDPPWVTPDTREGPITITRLSGDVVSIDPNAPYERDDARPTPEDELSLAEVTLNGSSELRSEIEKQFSGSDWPPATALIEPFRRYASKVFDANAAAYHKALSIDGKDGQDVLNVMARNLLSDVFGSEWESSPGEKVTRIGWQSSTQGWKGLEVVVLAGNDPDKNCLYHQVVGDAVMYRYRFHAVIPPPNPGEPPGINSSNLEWWQYVGLNERHNLAMAIKPYLEDRVAHWRFVYISASPANPDDMGGAAEIEVSGQSAARPPIFRMRKGDGSLLDQKRLVSFGTAEQYLGISSRHRQKLIKSGALKVEGQGQNRKVTVESLQNYLPPEIPN